MDKIFKAIYDCGFITEEYVDKNEIDKYLNKRDIKKIELEDIVYYQLSGFGYKICQKDGYDNPFRMLDVQKCSRILEFYFKLTEKERQSWINKEDIIKKYGTGRSPDGMYMENGKKKVLFFMSGRNTMEDVKKAEEYVSKMDNVLVEYIMFTLKDR